MEFTKSNGNGQRPRILCLHGMRTSGLILSRQMASFRYHVNAEFVYIDAPFKATGPPQAVVSQFYPNLPYYEWQSENSQEGLDWLLDYLGDPNNGTFDGILGFSQGARMAARVIMALDCRFSEHSGTPSQIEAIKGNHNLRCFIFIGGVSPSYQFPENFSKLAVPTLHIMGEMDPLREHSKALASLFSDDLSQVVVHSEGHNIPSLRTGLYPVVDSWIKDTTNQTAE